MGTRLRLRGDVLLRRSGERAGQQNDNEKKGETALINVVISTTPVTKTANGDDNEVGTKDESTVKT